MEKQKKSIKGAVILLTVTIFLSRFLGFIREAITAYLYGRSMETDAFFAAFTIPDFMYYLLVGGALASGFIPVFTKYLAQDKEEEAWEVASVFTNLVLILLVIMTFFGIVFAHLLVPLVAYKFSGEVLILTIKLTRIMFISVMLTALAGISIGILNSYNHFTAPAYAPIIYNLLIISVALLLGKKIGIYAMAIGVILGSLGNFVVQIPPLWKKLKFYKFTLNIKHPGFIEMMKLVIPGILGLSITQINLIVNQNIASGLDEGSITALRYANRLFQLPLGIFAASISTAIFPTLATFSTKVDFENFKRILRTGLNMILYISIPSSVGLMVLSKPIIRLLFRSGQFTEYDVVITAYALIFYSIGLFAHSAIAIITRGYYALHDTKTPLKIGFLTVVVNVLLNLFFVMYTKMKIGGIALSLSITGIINMWLLLHILNNRLNGIGLGKTIETFYKTLLSSAAMGVIAYLISVYFEKFFDISSKFNQLLEVGIAIFVGGVVFVLFSYLLKIEEFFDITRMVQSRIKSFFKAR